MTETQAVLTGLCAFVLWLYGFFMFVVNRSTGAEYQNHTLMGLGFLFALLCLIVVVPLISMASAIATCSAKHPGNSSDNLAKCISLLEGQGFTVQKSTPHSIYAKRGNPSTIRAHWEEWREVPIQVLVTATDSDSSSTLEVQCLANPFARRVLVPTTRTIAELDGSGLARLDREIMVKDSHRGRYSGLGRNIFWALAIISTISVAVTLVLTAIVQRNYIENAIGLVGKESLFERRDYVLGTLELPVRQDIDRQLTARAEDPGLPAAKQLSGIDPGTAEGRLVIALKQTDGTVTLVLPRQSDALEPLARAIFLSGIGDSSERTESANDCILLGLCDSSQRVEKAGDKVFVRFSRHYHKQIS